jgi:hypothetical protein
MIQAQGTANVQAVDEQAKANQINQYGPWGSVTYDKNGDLATAVHQNLSQPVQNIFNTDLGITNNMSQWAAKQTGGLAGTTYQLPTTYAPGSSGYNYNTGQVNTSNAPFNPATTYAGGINAFDDKVANAYMGKEMAQLQPQFDLQDRRLTQQLADEGLPTGGEAYNNATGELQRNQNNAMTQAASDAVLQGSGVAQQLFGMQQSANQSAFGQDLQSFNTNLGAQETQNQNYANAENQIINNYNMQRTNQINEINTALGAAPGIQQPTLMQTPQFNVSPVNAMGAYQTQYNGEMNTYNAQMAQYESQNSALGSLAGSLMFFA